MQKNQWKSVKGNRQEHTRWSLFLSETVSVNELTKSCEDADRSGCWELVPNEPSCSREYSGTCLGSSSQGHCWGSQLHDQGPDSHLAVKRRIWKKKKFQQDVGTGWSPWQLPGNYLEPLFPTCSQGLILTCPAPAPPPPVLNQTGESSKGRTENYTLNSRSCAETHSRANWSKLYRTTP